MQEVEVMKYYFFLVITFSFQFALGSQAFNGSLTKTGTNYYFTPKSSKILYQIITETFVAQDNLSRLENGDFITGNGTLDTVNKRIRIESIDYVGLRKLLGRWSGPDGTLNFRDFSTMHFLPRFRHATKVDTSLINYQREFRYSITPSDGDEWALFMSDDKSTTFATLEFSQNKVIMKIFESESGRIVRTLTLERR